MAADTNKRQALQAKYDELGIPTDRPGFYDHPNFQAQEAIEKSLLDSYAAFVRSGEYDASYLESAIAAIQIAGEVLNNELARDGRLGACIDTAMVLSRILDRHGIWNYVVKGALVIKFPKGSGIPTLYLWPFDKGEFDAAHAWVHAPPFEVIDIALRYQEYGYEIDDYVPEMVLAEGLIEAKVNEDDLFSPYARAQLLRRRVPSGSFIQHVMPDLFQFWEEFPPAEVFVDRLKLKYIGTGISASERPLEEIKSLELSGRTGIQIYEELVKPRLD